MVVEAATFIVAAAIHGGLLIRGYEHREARIAESVIAIVLLAGATLTWIRPASARAMGLGAQGFALLGTLVGVLTIAIGIGPRSPAGHHLSRRHRRRSCLGSSRGMASADGSVTCAAPVIGPEVSIAG